MAMRDDDCEYESYFQYADKVLQVSSTYGDSYKRTLEAPHQMSAYNVQNIVGPPRRYPKYGESAYVFSLGGFGKWEDFKPSAIGSLKQRYPVKLPARAFLDVSFKKHVYATTLDVYEVYEGGSVIRIWGFDLDNVKEGWHLLWHINEVPSCTYGDGVSRRFCAKLANINKQINAVRLEFNYISNLYYPSIDALFLGGLMKVPDLSRIEYLKNKYKYDGEKLTNLEIEESLVRYRVAFEDLQFLNTLNLASKHKFDVCTYESYMEDGLHKIAGVYIDDLLKTFMPGVETYLHYVDGVREEIEADQKIMKNFVKPEKPIEESGKTDSNLKEIPVDNRSYFEILPNEISVGILKLLDIQSLCRVSQTCRAFRDMAYLKVLYNFLTLKDWWWLINDEMLRSFSNRLSLIKPDGEEHSLLLDSKTLPSLALQREMIVQEITNLRMSFIEKCYSTELQLTDGIFGLDLSWCGNHGTVSNAEFIRFIHNCGSRLRILRVNCCDFIDKMAVMMIVILCPNLAQLCLSRCTSLHESHFLNLKHLNRLYRIDLSHTVISLNVLTEILENLPQLGHLNISGCKVDLEILANTLSTHNKELVSLNAWRARNASSLFLRTISALKKLTDLDIGASCFNNEYITDGLTQFVERVPGIIRLNLAECRFLSDVDIDVIASSCRNLKMINIAGNLNVTSGAVKILLDKCPELRFLNISHSKNIELPNVEYWRKKYRHLTITFVICNNET